jgi:hypothetical protein
MSLTVAQVYSARFGPKLSIPKSVQENIAKLRIVPTSYKPARGGPRSGFKPRYEQPTPAAIENWRIKAMTSYVSRLKDKGDPDYYEVFAAFNKVSIGNLSQITSKILEILRKRDQEFRLRVITLLFDKATEDGTFAEVMADCAMKLHDEFPEVREDLYIQSKMFAGLYDITTTLLYPLTSETDFTDKVNQWMRQKNKRRGYAKFLTYLFVRDLITEDVMIKSLQDVILELNVTAKQEKSKPTEENTTQYVDFLFECSKILPTSARELNTIIREAIANVLAIPRPDIPSLCMRSRFRLEDMVKCV